MPDFTCPICKINLRSHQGFEHHWRRKHGGLMPATHGRAYSVKYCVSCGAELPKHGHHECPTKRDTIHRRWSEGRVCYQPSESDRLRLGFWLLEAAYEEGMGEPEPWEG